ncbi:MAG: MFS transporter [Spirochaetales bacterium]|nr:MFS transporter [Spirochaetales bacterium]
MSSRNSFVVIFILMVISLSLGLFFLFQSTTNPLNNSLELDYPFLAEQDDDGNFYIIDKSKRRVIYADENLRVINIYDGGSREDSSFFNAYNIVGTTTNKFYMHNLIPDNRGFFTSIEQIIVVDKVNSKLNKVIYSIEYDDNLKGLVQRSRIMGLRQRDNFLMFVLVKENSFELISINIEDEHSISTQEYPYSNALAFISEAFIDDSSNFYFSERDGSIYNFVKKDGYQRRRLFSGGGSLDKVERLEVPWALIVVDGKLFFSDIVDRSIKYVDLDSGKFFVGSNQELFDRSGITIADPAFQILKRGRDGIISCDGINLFVFDSDQGKMVSSSSSVTLKNIDIARSWIAYIFLLISAIFFFLLFPIIFKILSSKRISDLFVRIITLVVAIVFASFLVSNLIINNFSTRYQNVLEEKLSQLVQTMSITADGDLYHDINSQTDYMNDSYSKIREKYHQSLNHNQDLWNNDIYFAVYRVIDERLFGLMYLNDGIGPFHPFDYYEDPESGYRLANSGDVVTELDEDIYGTWLYALGPVKDSEGNIVGILEVGTDLYTLTLENKALIKKLIFDVATFLAILILFVIEMLYFKDLLNRKYHLKATGNFSENYSDVMMVRPLTFLLFTSFSAAVAFIPVLMKQLLDKYEYSENLVSFLIALPLSLEMLFFGIFTLVAGFFVHLFGWRKVFIAGLGFAIVGQVLSATVVSPWVFLVARSFAGAGSGIIVLALRALLNLEKDSSIRSDGFSHYYSAMTVGLSIGAVAGGIAADKIGYQNVFWIALIILGVSFAFYLLFLAGKINVRESGEIESQHSRGGFLRFIFNYKIIGYFTLILIPTYVAGMFLNYFFPVYASENGISSGDIGRLFILNGFFIIYLGPFLSRYFGKKLGFKWSMILGSILWGISMLIFGVLGSLFGAILALILMGITEGFCANAQNSYYLDMKPVIAFGQDRATGYFEAMSRVAETIGPIVFSLALVLGSQLGVSLLGIVVIIFALIFVPLVRRER